MSERDEDSPPTCPTAVDLTGSAEVPRDLQRVHVRHCGNTATNGYYNRRILAEIPEFVNSQVVNWDRHSLAYPAWEELDFEPPPPPFFESPDWSIVAGAVSVNERAVIDSDGSVTALEYGGSLERMRWRCYLALRTAYRKAARVASRALPQQTSVDAATLSMIKHRFRNFVTASNRPAVDTDANTDAGTTIEITYGMPNLADVRRLTSINVALEHGTLRWTRVGPPTAAGARSEYRQYVATSDHLWVTNLDDLTLDLAEEMAPGRWTALPHPYFLDAGAPYEPPLGLRQRLLSATDSRHLILVPSSINWLPDHDKGTGVALEAFLELRRQGYSVGLVLTDWGRQVDEARRILSRARVADCCFWIQPQPRIRMQRLMGAVDVVFDQFGYAAFGAVAIKTMEQGTPLVTHSLNPRAIELMGERPPWLAADSVDDVVRQTINMLDRSTDGDRALVRTKQGQVQRSWLMRRHHHRVTAFLQVQRYHQLLDQHTPAAADPAAWSRIPDFGSSQWNELTASLW